MDMLTWWNQVKQKQKFHLVLRALFTETKTRIAAGPAVLAPILPPWLHASYDPATSNRRSKLKPTVGTPGDSRIHLKSLNFKTKSPS